MDTGIEIAKPIWLDPDFLTDFIDELRESGYRIGVSQYIAVQDLMVALANQGKLPENPERLRTLLAPILCSSPTEQEDFQYRFDDWVELIKLKEEKKNEISVKEVLLEKMAKSRWRFRRLILPVIAIMFSSLILKTSSPTVSPSTPIQPTVSPSTPIQPTVSPKPTTTQEWQTNIAFLVLALCLIFLGWRLWWFWRAQLFLERRSTNQQPELHNISIDSFKHNLLPLVPFIQIARNLRQRIRISSNDLDINKTIEASLHRGGWLTPIYGFRQIIPEYLFLIDRSSFRDHQAKFAEEIIDKLRHNGVFITSYFFDDNPLICFPSDGVSHPKKLTEIAVKHHQHRLVIITDADKLYDSATGEIENWVNQIGTWSDRAILTPKPLESWGYRELDLAQKFIVLPTNPNGFQILGQLFSQGKANFFLAEGNQTPLPEILRTRPHRWIENSPPDAEQIDTVLDSLQQYLGKDEFYWFSACAVFPELHWNITLYLGNAIKREEGHSLLETDSVISLARLPWFRYGYMPNWLRYRLIRVLTSSQESKIRSILQDLLITTVGVTVDSFQLKVAKHNHGLSNKLCNSILRLLFKRVSKDSQLRDYLFLSFMLRKPNLAVEVPIELIRLLKKKKKNYWLIGIGTVVMVSLTLSLEILYKTPNPFLTEVPQKKNIPDSNRLDISGRWEDTSLGQTSDINQNGNSFQFTTWGKIQTGESFISSGSGTIVGNNLRYDYVTQYQQSGRSSKGKCLGTVFADGMNMTLNCEDEILGMFVSSVTRTSLPRPSSFSRENLN
jgi:hypothetical protein